jgi:hypothetical protein
MRNGFLVLSSALLASGLIMGGLWAWHGAEDLVLDWEVSNPPLAIWGVRAVSAAAIVLAQVVLLVVVRRRLHQRTIRASKGV